jgi:hypothetical protein
MTLSNSEFEIIENGWGSLKLPASQNAANLSEEKLLMQIEAGREGPGIGTS